MIYWGDVLYVTDPHKNVQIGEKKKRKLVLKNDFKKIKSELKCTLITLFFIQRRTKRLQL